MKKIIIYFGDQTDKQAVVEQVLNQLNADYRVLQDHELGQRVGTLLGLDGFTKTPDTTNTHHSIDLMLFEEAADEDILQLNTLLQAAGTEMKRKAMLTEHNRNWRFHDLLTEIERSILIFKWLMPSARCSYKAASSSSKITHQPHGAPMKRLFIRHMTV